MLMPLPWRESQVRLAYCSSMQHPLVLSSRPWQLLCQGPAARLSASAGQSQPKLSLPASCQTLSPRRVQARQQRAAQRQQSCRAQVPGRPADAQN